MDIKIYNEESSSRFKFRVNGVLIENNKVLTVEMFKDGKLCCPGGHVMLEEDTVTAMKREFLEETGITVDIDRLLAVVENFFKVGKEKYHELSFYYILKANNIEDSKKQNFNLVENDKGKLVDMEYRWIALEDIGEYNFQPTVIKEKLKNKDFDFKHIIFHEYK